MIVETPGGILDSKPLPTIEAMADRPPAYSIHPGVSPSMGTGSHMHPPPTVDQVHIFSRHEEIKGTFYIDPHVPSLDQSRRKSKGKSQQLPHASFRTRKGDISIDLGTTGDACDAKKANIAVASHKGNIKIDLLPALSIRPLGLDVTTRKGNVVLFLPKNFSGVIHLTTKKGEMVVLPALANIMKVVKTSAKESLFMIQNPHNGTDNSCESTLCQLNTREGTIVVGLSGHDQYATQPGFWQRLGCHLRGDKDGPQ